MKRIIFIIFITCFTLRLFAQVDTGKKPPTLVFHVFYDDFKTAHLIHTTSIIHVLSNNLWGNISDTQMGFGFNYLQGIKSKIDFVATLDGSYTDYLYRNNTYNGSSEFLLDASAGLNVKLLDDHHPVVPYLSAGMGFSAYKGSTGFYIPVAAGLQFNIFNEAFVFTNMAYKRGLTSFVTNYIQYSIGIGTNIGKKKKAKPAQPPVAAPIPVKVAEPVVVVPEVKILVKDITVSVTDEQTGFPLPGVEVVLDGPNGKLNGTTDAYGKFTFNAIPAADYTVTGMLHGINTTAQPIAKNGFDTQGASIPVSITHNDPRFTLEGHVNNKTTGKPESEVMVSVVNLTLNSNVNTQNNPGDGTFNIQIETGSDFTVSGKKAGFISNIEKVSTKGLNRSATLYVKLELNIEEASPDKTITLSNIYYDTGSAKIRATASPDLEKLVKFLMDNPTLRIEIASHTDSRGSAARNLALSKSRALEVANYLQNNGVGKSRLVPKGYGATRLVNGCKVGVKCTEAQHEQNRRTEFKVIGN